MNRFFRAGAVLAAFLLVSCGGGDPGPVQGEALAQPLRSADPALCVKGTDTNTVQYRLVNGECTRIFALAQRAAATSVATPLPAPVPGAAPLRAQPVFTFDTFVQWAEATYPQYFRGTRGSGTYEGYTFRYYPATEHYLAVRSDNTLYALGPATDDEILYVGTLSNLVCAVYPANCAAATPDSVPGSTASTIVFSYNVINAGAIDFAGDQDWYVLNLTAGASYTFDMQGADTGKGTLADPVLRLRDAQGTVLASHDDVSYPGNRNSRLTYVAPATAKYFLSAEAYDSVGTYQLYAASTVGGSGSGTSPASPPAGDIVPQAVVDKDMRGVLKADGSVWLWGEGWDRLGTAASGSSVPLNPINGVRSLALGATFVMAVKTDGTLWSWGTQNLRPDVLPLWMPRQVGTGYASVSGNFQSWTAVKTDGTLWAWRYPMTAPVQLGSEGGFSAVSVGGDHSLFLKTDGSLWGMGMNNSGQLARDPDLREGDVLSPTPLGISSVAAISANGNRSMVIRTDGSLWAWGDNRFGGLGTGSVDDTSFTPALVGTGFASVSGQVAVKRDGTLWSWGRNMHGEVGDGTRTERRTPVQIGTGYIAAVSANQMAAALKSDGSLREWGSRDSWVSFNWVDPTDILSPTPPATTVDGGTTPGTGGGLAGTWCADVAGNQNCWVFDNDTGSTTTSSAGRFYQQSINQYSGTLTNTMTWSNNAAAKTLTYRFTWSELSNSSYNYSQAVNGSSYTFPYTLTSTVFTFQNIAFYRR